VDVLYFTYTGNFYFLFVFLPGREIYFLGLSQPLYYQRFDTYPESTLRGKRWHWWNKISIVMWLMVSAAAIWVKI
jgi:hypothetical protein